MGKRLPEKSLNPLKAINSIAGRPRGKRSAPFLIIVNSALKESIEIVDNAPFEKFPSWPGGVAAAAADGVVVVKIINFSKELEIHRTERPRPRSAATPP